MKIIQDFHTHLQRLGYGKTSLQMLPDCLQDFLEQTAKSLQAIDSVDILNYYEYLQERPNKTRVGGLSESYINHHLYSLKLFFNYQLETKALFESPISSLEFKSPISKPREILSQEEIKHLYETATTLKEKAMLCVFYGCGLRRTEGEKLNLKDLHFRSNLLYVREGKGSKRRAVPINGKVKEHLLNYAHYERKSKAGETAFLVNQRGTRMRGNDLNKLFKRLVKEAKIEKEVSLHSLRHSIATHLLENGLPVEKVRDFLGHQHLETTQIYTRVNQSQLYSL